MDNDVGTATAETIPALTPWESIPMCDDDGDIGPGTRRETLLREYIDTGSILGVYLCTHETMQRLGEDDASEEGPSLTEIDWGGFPAR